MPEISNEPLIKEVLFPLNYHIHILRPLGTLIFLQFLSDLHEIWHEGGPWDPNTVTKWPPPH